MEALYLDTHVVLWLRQKELFKFTKNGLDCLESTNDLLISPMVELELKFLHEIGRISDYPYNIIGDLNAMIDLKIDNSNFKDVSKKAMLVEWTRDPFDRLIVADTLLKNAKLLTKDDTILANFNGSFW